MTAALRIGCGAGFWGDSASGAAQLVRNGEIDVLVLDYLAEITMSLLARAKEKKPELGYATDFVDLVIGDLAEEIAARGIKVMANAGGWSDMGFPIAICEEDGSFVLTKPEATGGLVSPMTVAEQIVYEVHDPNRYILPDVVCDWSDVVLEAAGENRVRVSGAKGFAPPADYKASLTYAHGFRCMATMMIIGRDAVAKAARVGEAILARSGRLMHEKGFAPFRETSVEVLGDEANYGAGARMGTSREVVLKLAVAHDDKRALEIFAREIFPSATSMAQGITGFAGGRPAVQPVVRLASCLVPKSFVTVEVEMDGARNRVVFADMPNEGPPVSRATREIEAPRFDGATVEVPLIRIAHGRSGDKGDTANIGVLARRPEFLPYIAATLTPEAVASRLAHFAKGEVERYDWPGLNGFNFVLRHALSGGGVASLRYDPQGKGLAQILMDFPVCVPESWLARGGILETEQVAA